MRPTAAPDMQSAGGRQLRRDAAENAERVLAAAVRAGLAAGRHVPLAQVAAEAGVGVGTLYRRYPSREALMEALQVRAYRMLLEVAERALAESSTGLMAVERFLVDSWAFRDQLVLPLHGAPWTTQGEAADLRVRVRQTLTAAVAAGHTDGSIRADVSAGTVVRFGAALAQPLEGPMAQEGAAAEQRAIFLRGISAH